MKSTQYHLPCRILPDSAESARICLEVLPSVSRSFAMGIALLGKSLQLSVAVAYLLMRIADTIEDDVDLPLPQKLDLLDATLHCVKEPQAAFAFADATACVRGEEAHVELLKLMPFVIAAYQSLSDEARAATAHWLAVMVQGMKRFCLRYPQAIQIQTRAELEEYCYFVAGTVGHLLTDLWGKDNPVLRSHAEDFGLALQMVNILKDIDTDKARGGVRFVPPGMSKQDLAALCLEKLEAAESYIKALPWWQFRVRLFCHLPFLLALATVREVMQTSKVKRYEAKSLLVASVGLLALPQRALAKMRKRLTLKPFHMKPRFLFSRLFGVSP